MNPDELKAHRRAICEALIEGKQCQIHYSGSWVDQSAETIACNLFRPDGGSMEIRIKPEPRKVWIGWPITGKHGWKDYWIRPGALSLSDLDNDHTWQLVTEEVK